jgi:acetoin utilization protein AcuC
MPGDRPAPSDWHDHRSALFIHPDAFGYDLGPQHPMQPVRLRALVDLIRTCGLVGPEREIVDGVPAAESELLRAHGSAYIEAVKALSSSAGRESRWGASARSLFGLGLGDTPAFTGMHEASAAIAGSTLGAVRAVIGGDVRHAFSPAGGLHHAMRDRASGFCVYNDLVVGIAEALRLSGGRVLYLDFDAHHGDGVQAAFYDEPRVLTVSLHESGRYLFPGSGDVDETGREAGNGYAFNIPVAPFTQDRSWLRIVHELLPLLCERYQPSLIVSQHGVDGHIWDPPTHLALTVAAFAEQTRLVHGLAHLHCDGRWVAAGGGGYQPLRVVPRAWSALWAGMSGGELPDVLPEEWIRRWSALSSDAIPSGFNDPEDARPQIPRSDEIDAENERTALSALERAQLLTIP